MPSPPTQIHIADETKKPVSDLLTYTYTDDGHSYVVTWHREKTILRAELVDELGGFKHLMAQLIGFDGAYLRFTGAVTVECSEADAVVEAATDEAIWELMYFGKNHDA